MKVVFLKDLKNNKKGEIRDVADGFARNYLIPQGIAVPASSEAVKSAQDQKEADEHRKNKQKEELLALADKINGITLVFKAKGGGKERIHGSITNADIAEKLSEAVNYDVDKKRVILDEPLRQLGEHEVALNLVKEREVKIKVKIEEE